MERPKTDMERRALTRRLASKKLSPDEVDRGGGRLPEKFWTVPQTRVSSGSVLEALSKDREEDR